jgi:hypothetical protein
LNRFGNSDKFAIHYKLITSPFKEKGILEKTWGKFELWVDGKEVCKFQRNNKVYTYEYNLIYLVEWLCNNLQYILTHESFPLPVEGSNSIELINRANEFESEDEDEIYNWFKSKQEWEFKHSWFSSRGGSFLPEVFFRRVKNQIEICWENEITYIAEGVHFINTKGVANVDYGEFKTVLIEFLKDFLSKMMQKEIGEQKKAVERLLKKINKN